MKTGNNRRKSARWTLAALALALAGAAQAGRISFDDGWEFALKDCDFAEAPLPGGRYLKRFPTWFRNGIRSRPSKGRKCFADWNYFTKDSKLVPSGLLGPVQIKKGKNEP